MASISTSEPSGKTLQSGLLAGLAAYTLWGFLPLVFKLVEHVPSAAVVADRTLFSLVLVGIILAAAGRLGEVRAALADGKTLRSMLTSSLILGVNWLIYVYAVESGQVLETSFGYFINPLANVALGMLLLGERLNRMQALAIGIAIIAIGIQAIGLAGIPVVALSLAGTFAAYGYFRKTAAVGSAAGLFAETLLLAPLALGYLAWTFIADGGPGPHADLMTVGLLALTGPATAVPLLLFAYAVQRLRLTTIGMLQYAAPSIAFVLAIAVFGEQLNPLRLLGFALIWVSLAIYSADSFMRRRAAEAGSPQA
ncbi:MAG TPA: EamA family transporter RarD [Alphaproteobacteria bacterium]|nr:EamA family transporter RarD [Alphaproteobacteria bacterium]